MAMISASVQAFSGKSSGKELLESITRSARILFNFDDTIVFLQDADSLTLVGFPIGERQQRLSGFSIPLAGSGIIAESVSSQRITFAKRSDSSLGLVEEQLLRAMGTECLGYVPLITGQSCLGVLVGGLSSVQSNELLGQERLLKSFATQAATSLESSTAAHRELNKHVTEVNEAHRQASRKIVHEVNNPLSIIKNYLGVLDDKLANQEPVTEELSILNEEIDRVSRIVGGLADAQTQPRVETTEVNSILKDVVRLFSISRYLPASVKIAVKTTDQPDVMPGSADPLRQILLNLIKNAVEALPKGGVIGVRNNGRVTRDGHTYIELRISDNGAGIPADVLANLFSPVRSSKGGENRGLGLNIVQGLVNKINGVISCRSGESGTTFEILLPAHDATVRYGSESKQISNHEVR